MPAATTRMVWDRKAIRSLRDDPAVQAQVHAIADVLTAELRRDAPKDTGAGAASIGQHPAKRAIGATDIGWDAAHFYLIFPEYGTKSQREQRFARGVLDRHAIVD